MTNARGLIFQNFKTYQEIKEWITKHQHPRLKFHLIIIPNLPFKYAGVGTTRKIGINDAIERFHSINYPNGIIVNLDADCVVQSNYLEVILEHFETNPASPGCTIHFEHILEGLGSADLYDTTAMFELKFRYNVIYQRSSGFPSHHILGFAQAFRANAAKKVGGMVLLKNAEDAVFIQKIKDLGNFTFINKTTIFAPSRISYRTHGGSTSVITSFLLSNKLAKEISKEEKTKYPNDLNPNPFAIADRKKIESIIKNIYSSRNINHIDQKKIWPKTMRNYLQENKIHLSKEKILEWKKASQSESIFIHRFTTHILSDFNSYLLKIYPNIPLVDAAKKILIHVYNFPNDEILELDLMSVLKKIRKLDKEGVVI